MDIKTYLNKHYQASTAKAYYREIQQYLQALPKAEKADYKTVVGYLEQLRSTQSPACIHRILQSIKKYYNYLLDQEKRQDHPAESIRIKDYHAKGYFDGKRLLPPEEIDRLWQYFLQEKGRYRLLRNRNTSMLGLLLHQGLTTGEIKHLKPHHIKLKKAQVNVPASHRLRARQLPLEPSQILPLYRYLQEDRPKLLQATPNIQSLFVSKNGRAESGETLSYLLQKARPHFKPYAFNPKTIRMSVIARQFKKGRSLLQVQYFAGHKNPSSTERYKSSDLEALQSSIKKYHPLNDKKPP